MSNHVDLVVCGAGAAGMAAALAAARRGMRVALVEAGPQVGGTVAHALIHTLGGLYDADGGLVNDGLPRELIERLQQADSSVRPRQMGRLWVLSVCPRTYQSVVRTWLDAEERITIHCGARVRRVAVEQDRVVEVEIDGPDGTAAVRPRAVIDATGSADVVRRIDARLVHDDDRASAGGLVFTLRGVATGALAFPKGVGIVRALRGAAEDGTLPAECGKAWLDSGIFEDEVYVKLFVPLRNGWRDRAARGEIGRQLAETQDRVTRFLTGLPGFAAAVPGTTGTLGVRDGGRVRGQYCLTGDDLRAGRRFDDVACRGCWPIEYWDPDEGAAVEYLPDPSGYDIPRRSIAVQGYRNLWVAGKCLSADRQAQASARVAGTCWAMGEAAARAAAES